MKAEKTIVIGIDGGHFEIIEPWMEEGELPNIEKCVKQGHSSEMKSVLPPVTSPNWKCYSTGKDPSEIGIFWWENVNKEERRIYYPTDRKVRRDNIWDELSSQDKRVLVIGTPLTYPPHEVNGKMISGGVDALEEGFTYPEDLEERLKKEFDYKVQPDSSAAKEPEKAAKEIHELIESRFDVGMKLMEEEDYDFIQITSFYINVLQHFFWNDEKTKKGWKIIDRKLGELMEKNEDANFFLVSDHGSNEIEKVFNANTWLHEKGFLEYTESYQKNRKISDHGVNKENIVQMLEKIGVKDLAKKAIPESVQNSIPEGGDLKKEQKADKINWDKSDAIASGQGPLYILNEDKKQEIKTELEKLNEKHSNELFDNIYGKQEIYSGGIYMYEAPELILDQAKNMHIKGDIGPEKAVETPDKDKWKGENKKEAMIVGYGPDINQFEENIYMTDAKEIILRTFD